jgi:hypothetical protein
VNQFNDHGQIDMTGVDFAGRAAGQECNQRPETFPMSAECVGDVTFDRGIKGSRLFEVPLVVLIQLRLN